MSDASVPDRVGHSNTNSGRSAADTAAARRRGLRLPLEFRVLVSYQAENGEQLRRSVKTASVSVNGALLALTEPLNVGQLILLTNVNTEEEVQCLVRSVRQKNDIHQVGVEFVTWRPEFWEITFPREPGDPKPPAGLADSAKAPRK